ncbi:di-/tricarboxylate transporter [Owenweeksia hongkongensis DSM 17368]|uniref:Di-/tricarboxylate transporter n=1 Tax=Owenweeksia hongkongensis (strain DSM 17368 / CIP 108786 / JCM 12287 / NRRL B-23963 / UST20020801) TaxID=926562 RepID=G8R2P2_OWEHD|nr:SLC13 family permease [Owenweeksia hongkongensis]AEV31847.1 di-/tricarboxylate transporter [Owenweeksia hongkongensis DSM 17368]
MSVDAYIVIAILVVALFLFITEKVSIDLTAILIAVSLMLTGVVSIPEGLSGFSNQATITILALLILSAGLEETGLLERLGFSLSKLASSSVPITLLVIMIPAAILSAFLNNTAVITIFLPIVITMANQKNISPSLLLMPLAFVSILGGMSTLIGTSTNLLVNTVARQYGTDVLTFFEFAPYGIAGVIFCIFFFAFGGYKLIPSRKRVKDYNQKFTTDTYQAEIVISNPEYINSLNLKELFKKKEIEIIKLLRKREVQNVQLHLDELEKDDRLIIKADVKALISLQEDDGLTLHTGIKEGLEKDKDSIIAETVVSPSSSLAGNLFNPASFHRKYGAYPLAIRQVSDVYFRNLGKRLFAINRINIGDSILVEAPPHFFEKPEVKHDLIQYRILQGKSKPIFKQLLAAGIILMVVLLAALNIIPIAVSALGGVVLMAFLGIFKTEKLYEKIDWRIYFLLAGIIPLGVAMQNTGLDKEMAALVISSTDGFEPFWVILAFFLTTTLVTNFISNNAAALLMAPVVLSLAGQTDIDPKALLLAVTFGASTCFVSPLGYHTLAIIYGPGKYKFSDYLRAGLPITLVIAFLFSLMLDYNYNGEAAIIRSLLAQ